MGRCQHVGSLQQKSLFFFFFTAETVTKKYENITESYCDNTKPLRGHHGKGVIYSFM